MKAFELISYSRGNISGKRSRLLLVCLLPVGAELLFRLAEAAFYSLLLYFGAMQPNELFTGENAEQLVLAAVFTAARWVVTAPLICASAVKVMDTVKGQESGEHISEMLLDTGFIRRSIAASLAGKFICLAAIVPSAAAALYSAVLLSGGGGSRELFGAVNMAVVSVMLLGVWAAARITTAAVPFLLAEYPEKGGISLAVAAFRFMRGRRTLLLKLCVVYLPLMATLLGIPFFLPEFASAFATGISIYIKEDEYAVECGRGGKKNERTAVRRGY